MFTRSDETKMKIRQAIGARFAKHNEIRLTSQ